MVDQGVIRGDPVELRIEGRRLVEWESVTVLQALNAASGKFALEVPHRAGQRVAVRPQDEVELWFAGEKLIEGHADTLQLGATRDGVLTLELTGRDLAADMVDSSVTEKPLEFLGLSLRQLAERLAKPHRVPVTFPDTAPAGLDEPFDTFKVSPGEKAWAALERGCRLRGLLCSPGGDGGIRIQSPASTRADISLFEGNCRPRSLSWNDTRRFRDYIVRGQGVGTDEAWGAIVAQVEGRSFDNGVRRGRQLLILAEGSVDEAQARVRAQWEAAIRAARAERIVVEVPHWRQRNAPDSRLWRVNELVPFSWASIELESRELLIDQVLLTRDHRGEMAELTLVRPDAYKPQASIDPSGSLLPS